MPSREFNRTCWMIGTFIMPVALVKLTAVVLLGSSPQLASASDTGAAATPSAPSKETAANPAWTSRQLAAAQRIGELRQQPSSATPLLYDKSAEAPVAVVESVPQGPTTESPKFTLQAVMTSTAGNKALINGRPYGIGDRIRGTTWKVVLIDGDARSVSLEEPHTEQAMTIKVDLPIPRKE